MIRLVQAFVLVLLAALLSGCGYNTIQQKDEAVKAAWSRGAQRLQAPRRPGAQPGRHGEGLRQPRAAGADPGDRGARARSGSINVNADDPASLAQFQQAQGELQSAIGRLLVVSENYPQLKADQNFLQLQAQLEGTENRITVARQRYIAHRAGLQHLHPPVPDQPHRDDVRLQAQAELHRRERSADPGTRRRSISATAGAAAAAAAAAATAAPPAPANG